MKTNKKKTTKTKPYRLDPDAIIRSLRCAFLVPRDYSTTITRLTNTINRLPKGRIQICHSHNGVYFYLRGKYLRKNSDLLYSLARKRYCETLLKVLCLYTKYPAFGSASTDSSVSATSAASITASVTATASATNSVTNSATATNPASNPPIDSSHASPRDEAMTELEELIRDYSDGNLHLERILLTRQQYAWFYGRYKKKPFVPDPETEVLLIPQGDPVRSKSEQHVGIEMHYYAVPCHYEELLIINVQRLVRSLEAELRERNQLQGELYTYQGFNIVWNVPADLSWMNAPGSIWRSYDDRTGCLRLYPDYTAMLSDGDFLYWEHEGLMIKFSYRTKALERIEVIHQAGGIPKSRLIETNEAQANEREELREIIRNQILPWLWF